MMDRVAEGIAARAMALLGAGTPETALKYAEAAVAADPESDFAHLTHAAVLGALDRHEDALSAYASCTAAMAEYTPWHAGRITCLSKLGRHKQAIAAADEALRVAPCDSIIWYRYGAALARAARKDGNRRLTKRAKAALRRAIEFDPDNYVARIDLGWILLGEGRSADSGQLAREAMDLKPGDPRVHHLAAELAMKLGRWDEAGDHAEALASMWPGQPGTIRLLMRVRRAKSSRVFRAWERGSNLFLRWKLLIIACAATVGLLAAHIGVTRQQAYGAAVGLALLLGACSIYSELQIKRSLRKPVLSKGF
jgi:tetratricopeptide (TPR) repeat protein